MSHKVLILGGLGEVGGLIRQLLMPSALTLTVVDRQQGQDPAILCQDLDLPWLPAFDQSLGEADVVVAALPEAIALRIAPALLRQMKPGALWIDTLSVKTEICRILDRAAKPVERLSINPMFAPTLGWNGQVVAWVEIAPGPLTEMVKTLILAAGARVEPVSATTHDQVTAATQVATHAAVLAFGSALKATGYEAATVLRLATPPHRILMALLARIANANPEVYWEIQRNHPEASQVRASLLGAMQRMESLGASGTETDFAEAMAELQRMMEPCNKELTRLGQGLVELSSIRD